MALDDQINGNKHLIELGGSDFEIVDGQPNVISWNVVNEQGQKIGEVEELLFDPESRKVRYLVVNLDDPGSSLLDTKPDAKNEGPVLIPIGLAELHEQDDEVVLPHVTTDQIFALPAYEKGNVTPITESLIRSILAGTAVGDALAYNATDFYTHDHFNEENFYGNRRVPQDKETIPLAQSFDDEAISSERGFTETPRSSDALVDSDFQEGDINKETIGDTWQTADENLLNEDPYKNKTMFGTINEDEEQSNPDDIRLDDTKRSDKDSNPKIDPF